MPNEKSIALVSAAGVVFSVACGIIPPLRRLYEKAGDWKAAIMAIFILLTAIGDLAWKMQFDWSAMRLQIVPTIVTVAIAWALNQGTYEGAVKPVQIKLGVRKSKQS